jgi:hypothetical protein
MRVDPQTRAVALALYTESPGARLHLPREEQLPYEQHAGALLALLAVLQRSGFEDDEFVAADCLAAASADDQKYFDAALIAIGMRWRRPLGIVARVLLRDLDPESHDTRILQIVERMERYGRLANRLLFWNGDILDDIESGLVDFLNRASVPGWIRADRLRYVEVNERTSVTVPSASSDGVLHVILQRDTDALTAVLDDWLGEQRRTVLYSKQDARRIARIAEAWGGDRRIRWFHGMPRDLAIGVLKPQRSPHLPSFDALRGLSLDTELQAIADTYEWALIKWPNTLQESVLAFVSRDAVVADAWDSLLRRHRCETERISAFRGVDSVQRHARGAQFGESRNYGAAALIAAAGDGVPPWLIVEITGAHTWRPFTARLGIGAVAAHRENGFPSFVGVYRADDRDAYDALWRRLDYDDGIVSATVCGHAKASAVIDAYLAMNDLHGFPLCNALSQRFGWIYTHVHGGGASEHHAMFQARDPVTTSRVVAFAAEQPGWYLSGRW